MSEGIVMNLGLFDTRVLPLCQRHPDGLQLAFRVSG